MTNAQYERIKNLLNQKWKNGEIHADEYFGTLDLMDQDPDLGAAEASRILGVKIAPDPGERAAKHAEAEIEKKIKGVYGTAAKELKEKLGSLEKDYAERLAKKQKELAEGKITQDELKAWVRSQLLRQKQVKDQIDQCTGVLLHANEKALVIVNQEQLGVFAENANFQEYQINRDTGLNLMFSVYDEHSVERLIRDNPDLLPPKMVNGKKDKAWNQARITSAVTQAIIQGESIPALAKRIAAESAGGNAAAMMRYARTAMTAAQNAGRVEMLHRAQGLGIKCRKRWMATLDSRTRDSHQEMDGEVVGVDDEFSNCLLYPGDPNGAPGEVYNCRCTMTYEYDGMDNALQERRDNETGEMIEYQTYEEWKKQNAPAPEKTEKTELEKKVEKAAQQKQEKPDAVQELKETIDSHKGKWTEVELRDVGKKAAAAMEDIRKEKGYYENQGQVEKAKAEADKIWENASKLHAEWKDAKGEPGENDRWNAYKEEYDKFTKAQREVTRAQKSLDDHDATVMDLLSRVRKLGKFKNEDADDLADFSRATTNEKKLRSELIKAFNHYPEEWAINSAENWLTLKPEWNEGRAYYSISSGTIKISSKEAINLHELAHRFEKTVPGILQAEKEFYERRTAGEEAKWIGKGYDHDEVTRKDNFIDKYMGKDYNGDAYELCSMGFEYAFTNYKKLCKDEEYRDFILGILCGV